MVSVTNNLKNIKRQIKYFKAIPGSSSKNKIKYIYINKKNRLLQSILILLLDFCSQKLSRILFPDSKQKWEKAGSVISPPPLPSSLQRLIRTYNIFPFCSHRPVSPLIIQKQEVAWNKIGKISFSLKRAD